MYPEGGREATNLILELSFRGLFRLRLPTGLHSDDNWHVRERARQDLMQARCSRRSNEHMPIARADQDHAAEQGVRRQGVPIETLIVIPIRALLESDAIKWMNTSPGPDDTSGPLSCRSNIHDLRSCITQVPRDWRAGPPLQNRTMRSLGQIGLVYESGKCWPHSTCSSDAPCCKLRKSINHQSHFAATQIKNDETSRHRPGASE